MKSGIYKIQHLASGKVYIGSAANIDRRWKEHKAYLLRGNHHSIKLQRAWDKYGAGAFEFSVVESVEEVALLIEREQQWIDRTGAAVVGFNISPTAASCLGVKHKPESLANYGSNYRGKSLSPEHRRKIAESNRGKARSEESRARMSAAKKGTTLSPEARQKVSEALRGRVKSPETRQKLSIALTGKVVSEETKAKISAARSSRKASAETREKMSRARMGRKMPPQSPETKAKRAAMWAEKRLARENAGAADL